MEKKETPLMKQYNQIKAQYPGAVLLFRVGDFYETFSDDAIIASKVLGIVLTKRSNGAASEMELAGFPHHSLDTYLPKLVKAGYRVAVCDQLEDPKLTKNIVKRGVTELVTPGVSYNDKILESKQSNYLASLVEFNGNWGLSLLDISTGDFQCTQGDNAFIRKMIAGFSPAEFIFPKKQYQDVSVNFGEPKSYQTLEEWVYQREYSEEKLTRQFKTQGLKGFGIHEMDAAILAAGAALQYLENTHHHNTGHILGITRLDESAFVWLDGFTIRNLELARPIYPEGKSVLEVIDYTLTPMGGRLLKNWLMLPLKDLSRIRERHQFVREFKENGSLLKKSTPIMEDVGDLQRLCSKIALKRINPKELLQLARSLTAVQGLKQLFLESKSELLSKQANRIGELGDIISLITDQISPEAPVNISKGGIFNSGVNAELAELRELSVNGKDRLIEIQNREVINTGISSLKIGFNNVFGYYLEVTHSHKDKVPDTWIRKQTLTNAERYITPELKEYEEKILSAEDKIGVLELQLWDSLLNQLADRILPVQTDAQTIAQWDVLMGFSRLSIERKYAEPEMTDGYELELIGCRHPVIEAQLPPDQNYIPNDIYLDNSDQRMIILTGPNMSGKSAILRQTALAVLLAQMGCWVPCKKAKIGLVDKVYTRVGASDNISLGESTFMVEMTETASILNNLSDRSLVLLDEIGRGTSTYDGVSLAWSIAEYLNSHPQKPKTLFATHYHELNELEDKSEGIKNYHIAVKEQGQQIVFLRTLKKGGSEHSFGIHVAQLAGIPNQVLIRSAEILKVLEDSRLKNQQRNALKKTESKPVYQMSMFQTEDPVFNEMKKSLNQLDINAMSPIEALIKLQQLKSLLD
jgi:DNA mismatch repair protein MutS